MCLKNSMLAHLALRNRRRGAFRTREEVRSAGGVPSASNEILRHASDRNPQSIMRTGSATCCSALLMQSSFCCLRRRIFMDSSSPRCSIPSCCKFQSKSIRWSVRPQLRLWVAPQFDNRQKSHNLRLGRLWKDFIRRKTRAVLGATRP